MAEWRPTAIGLILALAGFSRAFAAGPGAMAVQLADGAVFSAPATSLVAQEQKAPAPELVPAPVPDPDLQAPSGETASAPSLGPALLSRDSQFAGNGFSQASSLDHGTEEKEKPAAGFKVSVPVVQ